jgi:eukaryotic-like serine/threonine-protein kinase
MAEWNPRVNEIFAQAIEEPSAERRLAYLNEACAGDEILRKRVDALLNAHEAASGFLGGPEPIATAGTMGTSSKTDNSDPTVNAILPPEVQPGTTIGPYKLIQKIGEGGMGAVFVAEQLRPVKRRVAVKVIKPGMDSRQVIARFEAERQALAIMDHPNIARVLDAGTTDAGRPYFVMELVKGVPITEYCDAVHLTPKERLALFLPVCQAIQHAHQKGIIHRDVKPSNVLIMMQDGNPVPKVIDFGIAKATEQRLTERSLYTDHGAIVGTLEYMSPEQAEMSAMDVDTRTDIYALGVLLYELLTGTTPLERARLRQAGYAEILRRIKEEEPPKPSTRLSESRDSLPSVAALRKTEPSRLTKLIRGDLDLIVMKAIEKDRTRRYETANGFARDIQRHLGGDPVEACPPSVRYRFGKFLRRNKGLVTAASLLLLALVAGIAGTTFGLVRAEHQRRFAEAEKKKAEQSETLAKEQRVRAEARENLAIEAVKRFRDAVANEPELKNSPQLEGLRKRLLKEPLAFFGMLRDHLQADRDTRPSSLVRLAAASNELGDLTNAIADKQDALIAWRESLAIWQKLTDAHPSENQYKQSLATTQNNIGNLLQKAGKPDEAMKAYRAAVEIQQKLVDSNPSVTKFHSDLARSHNNIGLLLSTIGKPAESLRAYESALAIQQAVANANPLDTELQNDLARSHNNYGLLQSATGRPVAALKSYESALATLQKLADDNPTVTQFQLALSLSHHHIGSLLRDTGKPVMAMKAFESALAILQKLADANPTVTEYQHGLATSHNSIGLLQSDAGKPAEAVKQLTSAVAIEQRLADANPTVTEFQSFLASSHLNIGRVLEATGKPAGALTAYHLALAIQQKLADANPTVIEFLGALARIHNSIGTLLCDTGKPAEALQAYEAALAIQRKLAQDHPESPDFASDVGGTLNNLAEIDFDAKRYDEARVRFRQAIEWQGKALAANPANPRYRRYMGNHWLNLIDMARAVGDSDGLSEAQRKLAELRDSDPAMAALDGRLELIIRGNPQPILEAERLALAQRAYDRGLYATAARLWGKALASNPKLGDDRQPGHRYNAACASALAGCGKGKDDPPPGELAKAKLRKQALDWLKTELEVWTKLGVSGPPQARAVVVQTLKHWQEDTDLAGIRDEKELAKLPDEDRTAFKSLWSDVDQLLNRAAGSQ